MYDNISVIADMSRAYGLLRGCMDYLGMVADEETAKRVNSTIETADSLWNSALERMATPVMRGAVRDA